MEQGDPTSYLELRLGELRERLESDSAPGGGSAAAVAAMMAASLTAKVARRSLDSWAEAGGTLAQARVLATRCAELARLDAEVFGAALAALREGGDVAGALDRTVDVLLELGEAAADVALLAARTAEHGDGALRGDAASAAVLAHSAARAAEVLVAANLTVVESDERLARANRLADAASAAAKRALAAGP